jgi:hypothetical protein
MDRPDEAVKWRAERAQYAAPADEAPVLHEVN